ncbi:AAA family ATPase [Niabella sp. CC-SYL272]|uniref:ATP-dependent nuclease n=1 Tax=Niabella agricola TaxID=2891571 RepID=UPI001F34EC94|nr:AAA family ATPase [Niabella agricola]MCF3110988.1 AAA family ATPase [Niabella agricola]
MTLITRISIQNFKCYRRRQMFNLGQSNFFIGANNAGKSAVLKAMHCFFDDNQYSPEYINQTELRSKGTGFNKTVIGITFDLNIITTKSLQAKLKKLYGDSLTLNKNFTYRENTNTTIIDYTLGKTTIQFDSLPPEVLEFLSKISVSYIHPQEAKELLEKAQEKLKRRLLSNWGRNAALADILGQLQKQWTDLRKRANSYLSNGLTQSLQNIWPGCSTKVDLPEKIEDVIGISEIIFKASSELPDVSLTSQGTGAQSTILYQTHFLLDSDKTLHRGFYYPIWLVEEPESFLHADIIFKLGYLLCSDLWLDSIQMLVSTHSPLLLATSKQNAERIMWFTIDSHSPIESKLVSNWTNDEVKEIGLLMGDPNFDIYFRTSEAQRLLIIEDSKEITEQKLIESGIDITQRLSGVTELKRYFDVLRAVDVSMGRSIFFLVDNDDGGKEFRSSLEVGEEVKKTASGFIKYKFENNVYLILFPEGYAMEELFKEHDSIVESCANQVFNATHTRAMSDGAVPAKLSRTHAHIRSKTARGLDDAKKMIRNTQDVKDIFWNQVEERGLQIDQTLAKEIKSLIN